MTEPPYGFGVFGRGSGAVGEFIEGDRAAAQLVFGVEDVGDGNADLATAG